MYSGYSLNVHREHASQSNHDGSQPPTLVDLNPTALQYAKNRLQRAGHQRNIQTLEHDIFRPFPSSMHAKYDSASLFYLFHCLPGKFPEKADHALAQIKATLKPDGVAYGATILGQNHS